VTYKQLRGRRIAVLADTDSRWKWAAQVANRLHSATPVAGYQLSHSELPSRRQLLDAGMVPEQVRTVDPAELVAALRAEPPDVLVVALPGGGVQATLHLLAAAELAERPLVLTGYVGVVYERVVEGLLLRAGADVIAANSPSDHDRFRGILTGAKIDPDCLALTRLPFLGAPDGRGRLSVAGQHASGRFTVTFAGQPGVPASRRDRRHLVDRLAGHARLHPERDVVVKLRSLPGERVTHTEPHPYADLVRALGASRPPNLKVAVGDMGSALDRTDLLVTVSSTAAAESIRRGVPTAILTDFGIRESLGNAYFLGSGCLAAFDDLDAGLQPAADPRWARRHGLGIGIDELPGRVAQLLASRPLPPLRPFYTVANAPAMLPGLLARYGLAADGRPLVQSEGVPDLVRTAVRTSARKLYRHGADVVAPALRKLATL